MQVFYVAGAVGNEAQVWWGTEEDRLERKGKTR